MLPHVAPFVAGLVVLAVGARLLVRGAVRLAARFGVSPFVIGVTVAGLGAAAPKLAVTLSATLTDKPAIAVGTALGSNIASLGLILGLAAVVRPISGGPRALTAQLPILLGSTLLFWFLVRDNILSRADGVVLLVAFGVYLAYLFRSAKCDAAAEVAAESGPAWSGALAVLVGLAGLVGGADLTVRGAVGIARHSGASELMIGLTVVAVGTSLSELAPTVAAVRCGRSGVTLGNVVGACVFNVLLTLGVTGVAYPLRVSDGIVMQELPVMALFALLLLPCLANGLRVSRWEGAVLLVAYTAFVAWQIKTAVK